MVGERTQNEIIGIFSEILEEYYIAKTRKKFDRDSG